MHWRFKYTGMLDSDAWNIVRDVHDENSLNNSTIHIQNKDECMLITF